MTTENKEKITRYILSFILIIVGSILMSLSLILMITESEITLSIIIYVISFFIFSLLLLLIGIIGLIIRIKRNITITNDYIHIENEWLYKKDRNSIPISNILVIFTNETNDFPGLFILSKSTNGDGFVVSYIEKKEIENSKQKFKQLSSKVLIDNDMYYNAKNIKEYIFHKYNSKSIKWL